MTSRLLKYISSKDVGQCYIITIYQGHHNICDEEMIFKPEKKIKNLSNNDIILVLGIKEFTYSVTNTLTQSRKRYVSVKVLTDDIVGYIHSPRETSKNIMLYRI